MCDVGSVSGASLRINCTLTRVSPKKRGPQKKIRQQLERIEALPIAKQRAIAQVLDSMLANQP